MKAMSKDELGTKTFYFLSSVIIIILVGMTFGVAQYAALQVGFAPVGFVFLVLGSVLLVASRFMK